MFLLAQFHLQYYSIWMWLSSLVDVGITHFCVDKGFNCRFERADLDYPHNSDLSNVFFRNNSSADSPFTEYSRWVQQYLSATEAK